MPMLIDTKNVIEDIKKCANARGIIASLLGNLAFAKDQKKLSVDERQQLGDLVSWFFTLGDHERVLRMGDLLLQIVPELDQDRWSLIDLALSMPWFLAQQKGDLDLVAKYEAKMAEAVTKRNPAFKAVFEKVGARQMNGEHLHDDEIAKAREAKETCMEIRAMTRQLQRLCWILARGGSERMPKALLEEKIKVCRDYLVAHTDAAFSEVYPA
jgi:hypothetical protein